MSVSKASLQVGEYLLQLDLERLTTRHAGKHIFGFQPQYVEGTDQVLNCATTLQPTSGHGTDDNDDDDMKKYIQMLKSIEQFLLRQFPVLLYGIRILRHTNYLFHGIRKSLKLKYETNIEYHC